MACSSRALRDPKPRPPRWAPSRACPETGEPAVPRSEVGGAVAATSSSLAPRGEAECSTPDSGGSVGAARAAVPDPCRRSRPAREPGKGCGGPERREGAPLEDRRDPGLRGPGSACCGRPGLGGRLSSARPRCPGAPRPPSPQPLSPQSPSAGPRTAWACPGRSRGALGARKSPAWHSSRRSPGTCGGCPSRALSPSVGAHAGVAGAGIYSPAGH